MPAERAAIPSAFILAPLPVDRLVAKCEPQHGLTIPTLLDRGIMSGATDCWAVKARYVFPVDAPPVEDGVVTIAGERILSVGRSTAADRIIDLGSAALLPGLVNAHTHLEFSSLTEPLGEPGISLPDWIRILRAWRAGCETTVGERVAMGLAECLRHGTTLVGEISQPNFEPTVFTNQPVDLVAFLELVGIRPERREPLARLALQYLEGHQESPRAWQPGLSPHAPYSISAAAVQDAVRLAGRHVPLAMHLAETREELQLLRTGGGPYKQLLQEVGVWTTEEFVSARRPLDYLHWLSEAGRAIVVHGNYLDAEEIAFLAAHSATMSVVYCPRTHDYFRHAPYPLADMLAAGVRVALGTDSRASSPDLNLLADLRFVARRHATVPSETVLALGTLRGAEALGRAANEGSLTPGKLANLVVVPLPAAAHGNPHELLFSSTDSATATICRGRVAFDRAGLLA